MFASFFLKLREDRLNREHRAGLPARRLATALLAAILQDRKPFDEAFARLAAASPFDGLEPRDRAFARAIAATALRRAGQIRAVLGAFLEKPLPAQCGPVKEIMLAAGAQLLFLKTPAHAVIDLAVHQAREHPDGRRFARLVNAVLRRVSERGARIAAGQDAERLNTPDWLWDRWAGVYGEETARRIAAQHLREPPLDLTVKEAAENWAAKLEGVLLPTGSLRLPGRRRIEDIDGYGEGAWWVQDAAAALPARLVGDVRGLRVADLCAAPGGKTAQLAAAGAEVWAVESSAPRLARLKDNLARLRLEAHIVHADAGQWTPDEPFDAVLLDAPCTATGTIRRHPDIAHLKGPEDVKELAGLQRRLLDRAAGMVKPGGCLVYCTCSLEPEEGPGQITRFVHIHPGFSVDHIPAEAIGGYGEWLDAGGALRTLPHYLQLSDPALTGMDGFYAVRLVKGDQT